MPNCLLNPHSAASPGPAQPAMPRLTLRGGHVANPPPHPDSPAPVPGRTWVSFLPTVPYPALPTPFSPSPQLYLDTAGLGRGWQWSQGREGRPGRAGAPVGGGEGLVKNPLGKVGRWREADSRWTSLQTLAPHMLPCPTGPHLRNTNSKLKLLRKSM